MEAATPRGLASVLDPGLSLAKEAAKALPSGKRPQQWKSVFLFVYKKEIYLKIKVFGYFFRFPRTKR